MHSGSSPENRPEKGGKRNVSNDVTARAETTREEVCVCLAAMTWTSGEDGKRRNHGLRGQHGVVKDLTAVLQHTATALCTTNRRKHSFGARLLTPPHDFHATTSPQARRDGAVLRMI